MTRKRVAYVVNNAAFFVSHRLPLAIGALQTGFDVSLFTGQAGSVQMEETAVAKLKAQGVSHRRTMFSSSGINPLIELVGFLQLVYFILKFQPQIVHCASPKGVLYGGIAARICCVKGLVLAVSGMGFAYTEADGQSFMRALVRMIYGNLAQYAFFHSNVRVIVQNQDDYQLFIDKGLARESSLTLIPGSGVNLSLFSACDPRNKKLIVLFSGRILKDKGVLEFVEAARRVKLEEPAWRFLLAGAVGYDNPSAVDDANLQNWFDEGCVELLGHVDDMVPLYRDAAIVCLPSYREGMPKSLLEAAAAGCAVVTTDVKGCREAVVPTVTADLVPAGDSAALAAALLSLINDEKRRQAYGVKGQELASKMFSIDSVVKQTNEIYKGLLEYE